MKRWLWLLLPVLLCGCGAAETVETVTDEWLVPAMAQPREVTVRLPEDLTMPVMEQGSRRLYLAEDYELLVETVSAGDLDATIQSLSGYERDRLTVMETRQGDVRRYEFVWTTTGEQGQQLGRGVILDDGSYHYCLSALRDPEESLIVWQDVFGSFALV